MADNKINSTDNRTSRDSTIREKTERKKGWQRPELLPSPTPIDGYGFRWVRISTNGESDPANFSTKIREGWEPCLAKDHPEVFIIPGENARFADNIVIGGLMLCKAPIEMIQERDEYYQTQAQAQVNSVDNNLMRESDPHMPMFRERKSTVSFGKG